jgi:aminoglycoside phosphotransferase (APT) family kinase protein
VTSQVASDSALTSAELASIAALLSDRGVPPVAPLTATLIAGGRSNLTLELSDGEQRWVLRTPPRTGRTPSAHDVAREYRVTAALGRTDVPVPPAVVLSEDESLIGGPFAISEYVDGRTIQTRDQLETLSRDTITAAASTLVGTLAALHRVDYEAIGLGTLGRPEGYVARQLRRWSGQWQLVGAAPLDRLARRLMDRLASATPTQRASSIVHGDFRIDNTILELDTGHTPRIAAVVDWELCTIGDPVADVAMMCAYRHPVFDLIVGAPSAWTSPALPTAEELAEEYQAAGGVSLADWEFHLALAYFKIAVIAAGIDHRRRSGSGAGPGFDTAGESVETYLELGLQTLGCSR